MPHPASDHDADLAKAFQELAKFVDAMGNMTIGLTPSLRFRGEHTAAAMEMQLTALEQKIDSLLASVDGNSSDGATIAAHLEQASPKDSTSR